MKIREEIEEIETHRYSYQPGYLTTDEFLRKSDILWILDEHLGECVAEGPLEYVLGQDYSGHRIGEDWVHALLIGIKPGDIIAIYVRRKK